MTANEAVPLLSMSCLHVCDTLCTRLPTLCACLPFLILRIAMHSCVIFCLQTQQEFEKLKAASSSPYVETLAYDSAWSLALALNRTMNMIESNDTQTCGQPLVPLEEFTYGESSTACLIRHSLSRTNFTGVSVS